MSYLQKLEKINFTSNLHEQQKNSRQGSDHWVKITRSLAANRCIQQTD